MQNILNITNADCALEIMKKANISGAFLTWKDVLHDGPVPEGLSFEELSKIRAEFIISRGWGKPENINRDFIERDNTLKSFKEYDKVILWFEHDLYDQLQVLQILDWFYHNSYSETELSIICEEKYLGWLSPDEMKGMLEHEEIVTREQLLLSSKAWTAFKSSSPEKLCSLLETDISSLPFLKGAVIRLLEEYPNTTTGLSRTAQQALSCIAEGEKIPVKVFGCSQDLEDRIYLGDSSFWLILQELLDSNPPLLELPEGKVLTLPTYPGQELTITKEGLKVLSGESNWLDIVDLDRWIGGVHLKPTNVWCWDSNSGSMVKRA